MPDAAFARLTRHWPLPEHDDPPVAYRAGHAIGRETFRRDLARAGRTLARLNQPKIVLFEPDIYAFAVWLLAAWSLGIKVVLPGDDFAATRDFLDFPWLGQGSEKNALHHWEDGAVATDAACDFCAPGVLLFTSGSSGEPGLIEKSLFQLRREVETLQQVFGGWLAPATRFVGSVPHQHLYGLSCSLLWPLSFAYPIVTERLQYPEDLWRLSGADYAFVSAPTFLKHLLGACETGALIAPDARWRLAISAGSPLPAETQTRCQTLLDAPLFEIYGSTETATAAYRQEGNAPWRALPGVRLSVDADTSRLRIHSPFLSREDAETGFLSSDLAHLDARGLELLGRADRIVKIGEKRISLGKVEQALAALPEIECAAVVLLHGERETLCAAVTLTCTGQTQKAALGKARFDRHLRNALRERLEAIALPRRWRYVDALPNNEMGKTTQRDLQRLFAPQFPLAECLAQTRDESGGKAQLQLRVAPDLVWFEGHFPALPVLPGVVQIDWAAHFARLHFGLDAPVTGVSGLKFQRLIRPGDLLDLRLVWRSARQELEFSYQMDETPCSRGVLVIKSGCA